VATPGALAGYDLAARHYGRVPWKDLVEPARRHVAQGFPLSPASHRYLDTTREGIFGWNPGAMASLEDDRGRLKSPGESIAIDHLDGCLAAIADEGVDIFYRGDIARMIAEDMSSNGGLLQLSDLAAYQARIVPALEVALDDWHLATAPSPSVGGAALAAMLLRLRGAPHRAWTADMAAEVIAVQTEVMRFRRRRLDLTSTLDREVGELLRLAARGGAGALASPSTVHASAVDSSGLACAITASAGYGSGVMPPGTGIWMNNSLGEVELNKQGFHVLPPGTRIPSNMAPTAGLSSDGAMLSIGSPGADRITTAILQTVVNFVHLDMTLQDAVNHPRLHVEWPADEDTRVAYEPGLPVDEIDVPQRRFDKLDMFFGGVSAVYHAPPDHFVLAADARRTGGTALSSAG
jgi:gamma-glutamyltranspeptidase/glutathione hydrolase